MEKQSRKISSHIVVFALDEPRYALELHAVKRIVRAVEITPLPKAPEIVLGVINVQGEIVPVLDIRRRFRLPERDMGLYDRFIIARTSRRSVALLADSVKGVLEIGNRDRVSVGDALPFAGHIRGVAKVEADIILIWDLDQFLSLEEERVLDAALYSETR